MRFFYYDLISGLRRVKRELLHTLTTCEQKQCREILDKYKIGELDTSGIDFSQVIYFLFVL